MAYPGPYRDSFHTESSTPRNSLWANAIGHYWEITVDCPCSLVFGLAPHLRMTRGKPGTGRDRQWPTSLFG